MAISLRSNIEHEDEFQLGDLVQVKAYILDMEHGGVGFVLGSEYKYVNDMNPYTERHKFTDVPAKQKFVEVLWSGSTSNIPEKMPAYMLEVIHRD